METVHPTHPVLFMTIDEIRSAAADVASAMKAAGETITPELRGRFIAVRGALFQRGVYDPVLVRFDSFTAPKASAGEVAEQLASVAESLR